MRFKKCHVRQKRLLICLLTALKWGAKIKKIQLRLKNNFTTNFDFLFISRNNTKFNNTFKNKISFAS